MEITKNLPIKLNVAPLPKDIVICKFTTKGSKKAIKINIDTILYCQNPIHNHMQDVITAGVQSINTSKKDTVHSLKFQIPKFIEKDRKQSFLIISLDQGEDPYVKAYVEDIKVDISKPVTQEELSQQEQQNVGQSQQFANQQIKKPELSRQSLANQLLASTIIPNARPRTFPSAPVDQFTQYATKHGVNRENIQIQDVQPRHNQACSPLSNVEQSSTEQQLTENTGKIVFLSTFDIKCGIATYTRHLTDELNKISNDSFTVDPTNKGSLNRKVDGKLIHIQHEFGIIPKLPNTNSKVIITWHTVPSSISRAIDQFESELNVVAHIVHCKDAANYMHTKRDVYVVNHGSAFIQEANKENARKILNINDTNMPIGFVFGFQGPNKLYGEIIHAAKSANIRIIISGSPHESAYRASILSGKNVTFLNRFLAEEEIDLYASASDILIFDYTKQDHYSCSGAMHRIIGAGKPVICPDTKHFSDVVDKENVLKFRNVNELTHCIVTALEDSERLGKAAREYANMTSWENIAKRHMEIYGKYVNV